MADEYIRRRDAERIRFSGGVNLDGILCVPYVEYIKGIKELPSADVAPVEYGEWISVPEMWGTFDVRYYCSKCGKNAIINNSERYVLSDYCPHCVSFNEGKK